MRITYVKVKNYRNIDGIEIIFNPECNYIIGENNIGKSNLLSLLTTVCTGKSFEDNDYMDPQKPIEVDVTIQLLPNEQGIFGDIFSPTDSSLMRFKYLQSIREAIPTIISLDSNESIPIRLIRKISFLRYETTTAPNRELKIDAQKGAGQIVSTIIERFTEGEHFSFLNNEQVNSLTEFINSRLGKIRSFQDYSIRAMISPNQTDMLTSLYYLSDGQRKIDTTGSGVQYMTMASMNILCQIMNLYKRKSIPFDELLYTNESGHKILPMILSIDEPEVHLHPYLQRSLINYYKKILHNKETDFCELIKDCFGVDGIDGQLIIVTHSTDALIGDYRNLIRFYKSAATTSVVSGFALQPVERGDNSGRLRAENEKHLLMHFPELKEAFYAKCVILIEGETEYGCIRAFSEKIGISLDDYGICAINARGENSITPIRRLLDLFAIPSIAIYDGDVRSHHVATDHDFFTNELCFEIEIVKALYSANRAGIIRKIVTDFDSSALDTVLDENFVRSSFKKMGIDMGMYTAKRLNDVNDDDSTDFCNMFSAWFMVKKCLLLGRAVGEAIPAECIPPCYSRAIQKAREVATSA